MNRRRLIALTMSMLLITSLFSGCSSTIKAQQVTTVTLGVYSQSIDVDKVLKPAIKAFQAENPKIKVQIKESFAKDYLQELTSQLDSKSAADLFLVDSYLMSSLATKGKLASLDSFIDTNDIKDFEDSVIARCKYQGKLYALPTTCDTPVFAYNKDMFAAAGISNPPTTWDELVNDSKLINKAGINKGFAVNYSSTELSLFMLQAGGKLTEGDNITINSPECVKGADFYRALNTSPDNISTAGLGSNATSFDLINKFSATAYLSSFYINYLKFQDTNAVELSQLGIAPLPAGVNSSTLVEMTGFSVNNASVHKKEAAEVAKFLSSKKLETSDAAQGTVMPVRKSVQEVYLKAQPEMAPVIKIIKAATPVENDKNSSKVQSALDAFLKAAIDNPLTDSKTLLDAAIQSVG